MGGVVALGRDVWRIPTAGDYINSFLFVEPDGSLTLVDTGMFFARKRIVAGLRQIGKHPLDVQRIILTHAHSDHAGSAGRLLPMTSASGATVHGADAEFIRAGRPAPAGSTFNRLLQGFPGMKFTPVPVITELHDGDVLDVAGRLSVHHTPGHTPGHVSLLHEESGVLITGDAIFNMNAKMTWPIAAACTDFPLTKKTAAALADLDYTVAAFTHGPDIRDRAREHVRDFLRREGVVAP
jgi:glyoxylase-like metal-dependent hydrolase (beta-lactamase superfamily II)